MADTLRVDFSRLQTRMERFARFGQAADGGIHRSAFSDSYMEAHAWLCEQAKEAGLNCEIDGAHNAILSLPAGPPGAPMIMTGSHIDSVPGGGQLDGALGVMAGFESIVRLQELGVELQHPIAVVAFSDEEGRFGGMLGSQAMAGRLTPESLLSAKDLDNVSLVDAMKSRGLDAMYALRAARAPASIAHFVELHIEQGPVLDQENMNIGLVEGIVGLFRWQIRLIGQANHAGTTPMHMRRDALLGLSDFASEIQRVIDEDGSPQSVATIGRVSLTPGAANVVPSTVEFTLDVRDLDPDLLADLGNAFRRTLSAIARRRGLMFEFDVLSEIDPVKCDEDMLTLIRGVAQDMNVKHRRIPSGAAHDAQMMAELAPIAMIFVPSRDGRSHSPAEWTSWEDIEHGANCLLNTLYRLAK